MKTKDYTYISKIIFWVVVSSFILVANCEDIFDVAVDNSRHHRDKNGPVKDSRVLFSPRMDYEQWKPIGQVDPLKNDPTYDYAPPVLDRVHYWIDPASRKPDPPIPTEKKTEVLVLGVSSKKPSTGYSAADSRKDLFESFMKFVDGPNLGYRGRPHYTIPQQTYYSPLVYYKNKSEQKEPYTMLVPPPIPKNDEQNMYQQPVMSSTSTTTPLPYKISSTIPNVPAIEEANLVYQSSSLSTAGDWKGSDTHATIAESSSHVTWKTPYDSNNTHKVYHKENGSEKTDFSIVPSMNVVVKPNKQNSKTMDTDIIVVSSSEMVHKGQVTDDTSNLSNIYVNIGKPDALMQTASGASININTKSPTKQHSTVLNSPMITSMSHPMFRKPHLPIKKLEMIPMTLQSMQTMQTMLPPPVTQHLIHKKPLLHSLLKKEMTSTSTFTTTTYPPPTTTSSLTTDAIFKHYKQPMEPVRGPMYLIIQGHSKVKTYGPSKQINGIFVQETNEIPTSDDRQTEFPVKHLHELMKDKEMREQWDREKRDFRAGRLQTLTHIVQTGLGAIDFDEARRRIDEDVEETEFIKSNDNLNETQSIKQNEDAKLVGSVKTNDDLKVSESVSKNDDDIKETEFIVKYDVSAGGEETSEVYHKGIVESEVPPNRPK